MSRRVKTVKIAAWLDMKVIVTHKACDLDAITSSWIIKKFLPGWENAKVQFVPAGERLAGFGDRKSVIEKAENTEVIHVDTGLGPLDHHQTSDNNTCATTLTFDYILTQNSALTKNENKVEAIKRIVDFVIDDDHFQRVFYNDPQASWHDFSIIEIIAGFKIQKPGNDDECVEFGMKCLDALLHYFESRVWAEAEIKEKGIEFNTRFGKALGIETFNDTVLKLGQQMGYVLTIRKDPTTGSVRIKARPKKRKGTKGKEVFRDVDIDLMPVYEKLRKMDKEASWFFHASGRMILNGSSKNPNMRGSKLTLSEVIEVLQNI